MPVLVWEIGIALAPTVVAFSSSRYLLNDQWRPLSLGVVATGIGLSLSIATYLWVFTTGQCSDTASVTCRVNENQGVLSLLAIVLAVIALWATALARTNDARTARRAALERLEIHLNSALGEVRHNLIHIAMAYSDDGKLRKMPQLQTFRSGDLDAPEFSSRLNSRVRNLLNSVVRTGSKVQDELPLDRSTPDNLVAFTVALLRFMNAVITQEPNHPSWLHDDPIFRDMANAARSDAPCPFYSSEVRSDIPKLRTQQLPVFCWIEDEELPGVEVVEMKERTRDFQLDYLRRQYK